MYVSEREHQRSTHRKQRRRQVEKRYSSAPQESPAARLGIEKVQRRLCFFFLFHCSLERECASDCCGSRCFIETVAVNTQEKKKENKNKWKQQKRKFIQERHTSITTQKPTLSKQANKPEEKKKEQIEHTNKWKGIGSLRRGGEATRTFVKERPTHGKKKKATNIQQGKQKSLRKTIQAKKKKT